MTGLIAIALTALTFVATACVALVARRQRHGAAPRPLSPVTPGARAFAAHVGTLSDLSVGLRPPPRGEGWRKLSSLGAVR